MALTIGQIAAISYTAVLNEKRKPANQWAQSSLLAEMQKQGFIVHKSLGDGVECTLDYRSNPDTEFTTELQTLGMNKTEVITAASYDIAELSAPVKWSKKDEVQNPTENQKVNLATSLMSNAIESHDDKIETGLFATSTVGFLGYGTHISTAGTGSDGGIDSSVETWWRNQQSTYVDDTDIEAAFTTVYNNAAKGSGATIVPTLMVSDGATQAIFEGSQQAQQRWVDTQDLKAGFKTLGFKTCRYVFSPRGGTSVFFTTPRALQLVVSKEYFRDKSETQEIQNQNGFVFKIYSALQLVTNNRSRLGVAHL